MRNHLKKYFSLTLILILATSFISCTSNKTDEPLSRTDFFMGTVITVTLYDNKKDEILNKAFDEVKRIENLVSINKENTELDKVNESAGISPVKVSDDTYNIIKAGLNYSIETDGHFDVTIGPIVKLWSIGLPEAKVPTDDEITDKLQYVNYKDLELNDNEKTVFLKREGMILDLGAVAKGYTADRICEILKENNVSKAIIDLGGNIFALGEKSENTPWKIGIQNPEQSRGDIIGSLSIENKSVVTSGIYERFIEQDDKKYHHILSPFTGYPYENEIAGVTIISEKSIDGDALSTSTFSLGVESGLEFINNKSNVEAIFITKDRKVYLSDGVKDMFKLTNTDFTIMN